MTRTCRTLALSLSLLVVLLLNGCIGAAIAGGAAAIGGGSAVAYHRGWYRGVVAYPHFQADQAVRRVARRARFIDRERTCDGYSSVYLYQDLHDVKVRFKLKAVTPESTRIYIRVGSFGDKASSQELFEALEGELEATVR